MNSRLASPLKNSILHLRNIRTIHNASRYRDTLTVIQFPEALKEGFIDSATRYANAAHQVSLGKAKWGANGKDPLLVEMPDKLRKSINSLTCSPQTKEIYEFKKFINDFTAGKIPVGVITGMPVNPIPFPQDKLDVKLRSDLEENNKDFQYNSCVHELMMQVLFGFVPFYKDEKPGAIILLNDEGYGSFLSKKGLPWHVDGSRQVDTPGEIPGIVSLLCINTGDDVTKFVAARELFNSLTARSREELLKPQYKYIEVRDYVDSAYFPVFLKNGDDIGIQLTTGHETFSRTLEGRYALSELKGKLEELKKSPGSTAEVILEKGDLAVSLNAPYEGENPEKVVNNSLHLRQPGAGKCYDRLLTRQHYGSFAL